MILLRIRQRRAGAKDPFAARILFFNGLLGWVLGIGTLIGVAGAVRVPAEDNRQYVLAVARTVFEALPAEAGSTGNPLTLAKVELGRQLYYDPRLSRKRDTSCNSCHNLAEYGVDGTATSARSGNRRVWRNAPSVYNAGLHIAQFWDGRASDLVEQARQSVLSPAELDMPSEAAVVAVLSSIPDYAPLFCSAFPDDPDPVSYANMASAIAAFESKLLTPSRFDRFLAGEVDALDNRELEGLDLFMRLGCSLCHGGAAVGGGMYQPLGFATSYPSTDTGRFAVTGRHWDRNVFKVPSLRNVAKTGPFFHDGRVGDLGKAVRIMAHYQVGADLPPASRDLIVAFLHSLTGTIDMAYVAPPSGIAAGR